MKRTLACLVVFLLSGQAISGEPAGNLLVRDDWVTVFPREFQGAINNPLKGFRAYKEHGYGLLVRKYIGWNELELSADDTVDRIIALTNKITVIQGKRFEDLNIKLVPRVYLDWEGRPGRQHWPADLHTFDYDSPTFQERLKALVAKLGQAWDEDPRIFAVQMGLIGYFGEHHHPAPTPQQRRLLAEAFQSAFKNKPVLVRHNDPEFMEAGFGIYYDTFANLTREPPFGPKDQFPWQATFVYRDVWKHAPIEGEVEYNWQKRDDAKATQTFGLTPDETLTVPAYRRYMIDKIRRYHASYLGWISSYNDSNSEVVAGAGEVQKVFGYRFVLESVSYPLVIEPGKQLTVKLTVRNTGSAPFYLDWPVAVALLDPTTRKPVWMAPLDGVDIRQWMPGEDWDSSAFAYRRAPAAYPSVGRATVPENLRPGQYIIALGILDRQGGMLPSVRFAIENYFRGGWHPLGFIGVGQRPTEIALKNIQFDSPAFDETLHYKVPQKLLAVSEPPVPKVKPVTSWSADPNTELINPWRYWTLNVGDRESKSVEKEIHHDGPVETPAGRRVIRVTGDFGQWATLNYQLESGVKLAPGRYRLAFLARGTPAQTANIELMDGRTVVKIAEIRIDAEWKEYIYEFEIKEELKDETTLRFRLSRNVKGTFDLTDARLKRVG